MKKCGVGLLSSLLLFAILDFLLGMLIPDKVLTLVFAVTMTVVFVGLLLVVYGSFTRNRWVSILRMSTAQSVTRSYQRFACPNHVIKCSGEGGLATNAAARWTSGAT